MNSYNSPLEMEDHIRKEKSKFEISENSSSLYEVKLCKKNQIKLVIE
jgi:hypothetical protein